MYKYESKFQTVTDTILNEDTLEKVEEYSEIIRFQDAVRFVGQVIPGILAATPSKVGSPNEVVALAYAILEEVVKQYGAGYKTTATIAQSTLDQMAKMAAMGQLGISQDGEVAKVVPLSGGDATTMDPNSPSGAV